MKKGILNKLTIVDYIIIIAVICAVVFAFIHITTDDSNDTKTSSYDSSTMNKIVENYLKLYLEGNVVETTVSGYNASTGKAVELHGNISWIDDDKGSNVKVLINSNGKEYLAGIKNGFFICRKPENRAKKIRFEWKRLGTYFVIEWELFINVFRRFLERA